MKTAAKDLRSWRCKGRFSSLFATFSRNTTTGFKGKLTAVPHMTGTSHPEA